MRSRNLVLTFMRLQDKYHKQIVPEMMKKFGYKSEMAVPRLKKIVVNVSFGSMTAAQGSAEREKAIDYIKDKLSLLTGQQPALHKAKKSIAAFKLREGVPVAVVSTLRGARAEQFLEKLINIVLPRSRDFHGIPLKSLTEKGDLTIGFKEYTAFPEVVPEREKGIFGLEITISTTARNQAEGEALLRALGVPLQNAK